MGYDPNTYNDNFQLLYRKHVGLVEEIQGEILDSYDAVENSNDDSDLTETSDQDLESNSETGSSIENECKDGDYEDSSDSEHSQDIMDAQSGLGHGRRKYEDRETKRERKHAVKTQKREQRLKKTPKHIKKRKEKTGRRSIRNK